VPQSSRRTRSREPSAPSSQFPPRRPRASGGRLLANDPVRGLAGLIPLEVFNVYGGRRWNITSCDVEPFMRYLARCAPRLREVGLFCAKVSAVLPFRCAISTELTGFDLRNVEGLDDLSLATLLRSRTGRRLRSLSVVHARSAMLQDPWPYDALGYRTPSTSDADRVDSTTGSATPGDNAPPDNNGAAASDAHESKRGASGLRLRRAHIDISEAAEHPPRPDLTDLWMLSPRAVLGPYCVPHPF
jgi:hypothetical protein